LNWHYVWEEISEDDNGEINFPTKFNFIKGSCTAFVEVDNYVECVCIIFAIKRLNQEIERLKKQERGDISSHEIIQEVMNLSKNDIEMLYEDIFHSCDDPPFED
jgi:hypothetical protein